jgi:serine/threonine-protein kinase
MEGKVIADRYAVGELLGRGGMAEVWAGTDRVLDRPIAIKVLGSWLAHDATFVERFRREALAAARVSHPNLVAVYDAGAEDGTPYIVMEHVPGETLADTLRRDGRLEPAEAAGIAAEVARALAVAHAAGIVHRDVKPANVMVTPQGRAKLMDLGIARSLDGETITRASTVLGTAGYLSPEQVRGERVDARSDLYSLGCVLYEMVTGHPPFEADGPMAVAYKHLHEDAPAPSEDVPGVPPSIGAVTRRAMAKDPEDRFASAGEFTTALEDATAPVAPIAPTSPLPVAPPGPRHAARRPRRRSWWPGLVLIAAGLALAAALAFGLLDGDTPRSPPVRSPSPSTTPSPSASASSSPSASPTPTVDSLQAAVDSLFALVDEGVADGRISDHAADEIRHGVEDALQKADEGDGEKAIEELEKLREKVGELVDHEEIANSERQKLEKAIDAIEEQIAATQSD